MGLSEAFSDLGKKLDEFADSAPGGINKTREDVQQDRYKRDKSNFDSNMKSDSSVVRDSAGPQPNKTSYADGGLVGAASPSNQSANMKENFKHFKVVHKAKDHMVLRHKDGHEVKYMFKGGYAEGGDVEAADDNSEQPDSGATDSWTESHGASDSWQQEEQPSNMLLQQQPQQQAMPQQGNITAPMQQAEQMQEQGVQNEARAQGALGNKEAALAQDQAQQKQALLQTYQSNLKQLEGERQSIVHDLQNKHIDAGRYMRNLSTSGQVATGIGLILGGMGAGILGRENDALKILQNNIDRDVESQKADIAKQEGLMHATMQQFGNLRDATNMTKVITTEAYIDKMQQAAAESKNPMAIARAQQAIGQLRAGIAPLMMQTAQRQTIIQGIQGGQLPPEAAVQALVPAPHQKEVFHEIQTAQNAQRIGKDALSQFDKAAEENTVMKTGAGLLREPASVGNLQALMLPLLKDAAGRVSEQEMHAMDRMLPRPGDSEYKIQEKRAALHDFITAKQSAPTAKGYGIDLTRFPSTAPTSGARPNMKAPKR